MARPGFIAPHLRRQQKTGDVLLVAMTSNEVTLPEPQYKQHEDNSERQNASACQQSTCAPIALAQDQIRRPKDDCERSSASTWDSTITISPAVSPHVPISRLSSYSSRSAESDLMEMSIPRKHTTRHDQHHYHHLYHHHQQQKTLKGRGDDDNATESPSIEDEGIDDGITDSGPLSNAESSLTRSDKGGHDGKVSGIYDDRMSKVKVLHTNGFGDQPLRTKHRLTYYIMDGNNFIDHKYEVQDLRGCIHDATEHQSGQRTPKELKDKHWVHGKIARPTPQHDARLWTPAEVQKLCKDEVSKNPALFKPTAFVSKSWD